jgi:heavy metal sensor kinase
MFRSVRIRLTLWYIAAMTVVLVILAATTYILLRQDIVRRADANATELADSFLATVNAEVGDSSTSPSFETAIAAAISEHRFRDVVYAVLGPDGKLVATSQSGSQSELPPDLASAAVSASLPLPGPAAQSFRSIRVGNYHYRSYVRHFSIAHNSATLIVLQSLRPQNEFQENLARTFLIAIPLAILLAGAGGYLMARRSLSPVVAMSTQASRIGSDTLNERLVVRNPRDELGQLAASFNELLDRLNQSFERQRRFVADASHELRTPIAILCGEAEVALRQQQRTGQEYRESLQILQEEAIRLKHIVEDLFTLARADAGQHPLAIQEFYLDELAAECSRNVRTLASAKEIAVSFESQGELPIHADESLLRRMLLNLLDNAIKYTPRGGTVSLRCGSDNGWYRLDLTDSGQGVPEELQSRIFERFFRVDKARRRGESDSGGAGLGLSIASWIASTHGGTIELTRTRSPGSTFTVLLPKQSQNR